VFNGAKMGIRLKVLKINIGLAITIFATNLTATTPETYITVLVHGTIKPRVGFGDIGAILIDDVQNTRYQYITEYLRQNSYYSKSQAMQKLGLAQINLKPSGQIDNHGATAMGNIFNYLDQKVTPNRKNYYYTFGGRW